MTTAGFEMGYLNGPHPHHPHGHGGGGGGGMWWGGGPSYYPDYPSTVIALPMLPQCPPNMVATVEGTCVKRPTLKPQALGQFNPLQTITQAAMTASGVNPANIQKDIQNISKDVEMYAYAQLGLQTVAAAATFGLFLMMLYRFLKDQKRGAL